MKLQSFFLSSLRNTVIGLSLLFGALPVAIAQSSYIPPGADKESFVWLPTGYLEYSKDNKHVYYGDKPLQGADPKSFQLIPGRVNSKRLRSQTNFGSLPMARDKSYVYVGGAMVSKADPGSFEVLKNFYAKDKNRIFFDFLPLDGSDPASFQKLDKAGGGFPLEDDPAYLYNDKNHVYLNGVVRDDIDVTTINAVSEGSDYSKDKNHVYRRFSILKNADPETFSLLTGADKMGDYFYVYKDKHHLYIDGKIIPEIDGATFSFIKRGYAKDKNHIFYGQSGKTPLKYYAYTVLQGANPATFSIITNSKDMFSGFSKDDARVYYYATAVDGAAPDSFVFLWRGFAKDNHHIYFAEDGAECGANSYDKPRHLISIALDDKKLLRALDDFDSTDTRFSGFITLLKSILNWGHEDANKRLAKESRFVRSVDALTSAINTIDDSKKTVHTLHAPSMAIEGADTASFHVIGYGIARDKNRLYYCSTDKNLNLR